MADAPCLVEIVIPTTILWQKAEVLLKHLHDMETVNFALPEFLLQHHVEGAATSPEQKNFQFRAGFAYIFQFQYCGPCVQRNIRTA